ncbi:signal recognition particle-docking protein FtsY [Levilactobacillus suantsaii]|uniref:Signal recognition particle receptor FtsY n=1 Tax=Levilactobacillus suantsaii TaxID=2292255 RepID=A0A4Q0VIR0_9LACO|nr:signal recognition particle-docking protein FtsY [Levilactobacillus suantsaii]QMU07748.1 signal recognition particle-docking protein FtsY [Levilactobacillus suantsaii]RXI79377.1 signal recognition particle-docking protein FtsY [Levilactobacillus suantsaii]
MGLFDIFRRRAKHPKSAAPDTSETSQSLSEASAAPASEVKATSEAETSTSDQSVSTKTTNSMTTPTPATDGSTTAAKTFQPTPTEESVSSAAPVAPAASQENEPPVAASTTSIAPASASSASQVQPTSSLGSTTNGESETSAEAETSVSAEVGTSAGEKAESMSETTPKTAPEQPTATSDEQLYDRGLAKTRHTFGERLNALLANFRHVDEGFFDDLEETLIGADVGFDMAVKLSDSLRDEVKLQNAKKAADVQNVIVEKMVDIYDQAGSQEESNALNVAQEGPTVILFVGVNGVGKTTTIGKMANRYHQDGKKVLLAAADTFRAGATEQLDVWAKRADVDIVTGKPQSDPAAVVYDAVQKAKKEDYDILFVDTAGRLQNKVNLMNELAKMKRIITREIPTAPHEVLLVLDATTGQNALTQAKLFKEATDVTGIVLTKLDGTARGGIVLAIRNELHVPVKFIGLGEQIGDLRPFDPSEFVYGLFKGLIDVSALGKK